jgi:hypothetical protein
MDSFKTVLCKDSTIADITPELGYVVESGAAQTTYQQFPATAASSSNMIFNVQVPSENIVIGRDALIESQMGYNFSIGSADQPVTVDSMQFSNKIPAPGAYIAGWGRDLALNAFPMSMLMNTATATINTTSISVNLKDVLPQLLRLNDSRFLYKYNGMTPSLPDQAYYAYKDGVGAINNPLGSYNNSTQDVDLNARGSFPVRLVVQHFGAGVSYTVTVDPDPAQPNVVGPPVAVPMGLVEQTELSGPDSLKQSNWNVVPTGASAVGIYYVYSEQFWKVYVEFKVTEPIFISPFTWSAPEHNAQGFLGINNMSFNFNIDSTLSRIMCDGTGLAFPDGVGGSTPAVKIVSSGVGSIPVAGGQSGLFSATNMLLKFLSTQPSDRLETKNVVPFMDFPRYLTSANNNQPLASGAITRLISNNLQLNQIPDYFIICVRKQMSAMTIQDASTFLTIRNISVNLNNSSGLLSSARAQDLWKMSMKSGSTQSWLEFSGKSWSFENKPDSVSTNATGTGGEVVATTGSLLVLSPAYHLSLPDYISAGSLGNFNFQVEINVENQSAESVIPEICIVTVNSGIFVTQQGVSSVYSGILTREMVLKAKSEMPVSDQERRVGGKLLDRHKLVKLARKLGGALSGGMMSGAGKHSSLSGMY